MPQITGTMGILPVIVGSLPVFVGSLPVIVGSLAVFVGSLPVFVGSLPMEKFNIPVNLTQFFFVLSDLMCNFASEVCVLMKRQQLKNSKM